jgi:hypothetical protein
MFGVGLVYKEYGMLALCWLHVMMCGLLRKVLRSAAQLVASASS